MATRSADRRSSRLSDRRSYGDRAALLEMLRLPVGQMYFARFAKKEEGQCNLLAWFAVQEFKTVPAECLEFRQHKAREIVRKYVTVGARSSGNTAVGEELAAADRAALENLVLLSGERLLVPSDEPEELPSNAFDPLEEAAVTALSGEFFARPLASLLMTSYSPSSPLPGSAARRASSSPSRSPRGSATRAAARPSTA